MPLVVDERLVPRFSVGKEVHLRLGLRVVLRFDVRDSHPGFVSVRNTKSLLSACSEKLGEAPERSLHGAFWTIFRFR